MSIRAYKVNKIIEEEINTFNLTWDSELADFLLDRSELGDAGNGIVWVELERLEEAVKEMKTPGTKLYDSEKDDESRNDQIAALERDIKIIKEAGDTGTYYFCY